MASARVMSPTSEVESVGNSRSSARRRTTLGVKVRRGVFQKELDWMAMPPAITK